MPVANHSIPGEMWGNEYGGGVPGVGGRALLGEVGGRSVGSSWLTVTCQVLAPTVRSPAYGSPREAQRGSFRAFPLVTAGKALVLQICLRSEM